MSKHIKLSGWLCNSCGKIDIAYRCDHCEEFMCRYCGFELSD